VLVTTAAHPSLKARRLKEIARSANITAVEAYQRIVHERARSVVCSSMNEAACMLSTFKVGDVASDGGIGSRHLEVQDFSESARRFAREQHWFRWRKRFAR